MVSARVASDPYMGIFNFLFFGLWNDVQLQPKLLDLLEFCRAVLTVTQVVRPLLATTLCEANFNYNFEANWWPETGYFEVFWPNAPIFESQQIFTLKGQLSSRSEQTFNRAWNQCSSLTVNTVTENYWLIYAAATVKCPDHVRYYFQWLSSSKTSTPNPRSVDRDDIVPLTNLWIF